MYKTIEISVSAETRDLLVKLAKARRMSMTQFVRFLIQREMERRGLSQPKQQTDN